MTHAIPDIDELVREYLLFRGFTSSLRTFEGERRTDKVHGFKVERILAHIHKLVSSHDVDGLLELWELLKTSFFSRLEMRVQSTVDALETAVLRYFLIHAVESGRRDVVAAFFAAHGDRLFALATAHGSGRRRGAVPPAASPADLLDAAAAPDASVPHALPPLATVAAPSVDVVYSGAGGSDWLEWFALAVVDAPEKHPTFAPYFSKAWVDHFAVSLSNFLNTVFQALPLPQLLAFNQERLVRNGLEAQVRSLRSQVHRLRAQLKTAASEIADLDKKRMVASTLRVQRVDTYAADRPSRPHPSVFSAIDRSVESARPRGASDAALPARTHTPSVSSATAPSPPPSASARPPSLSLDSTTRRSPSPATAPDPFIVLNQEVFADHKSSVTKCLFSADGSSIASASTDGTVRLWTFSSFPSTRNAVIACSAPVLSLEWESMSDRLLLAGTAAAEVKLWSVNEKKELYSLETPPHVPRVTTIACSPSSQSFVAALADSDAAGELRAWDLRTLQESLFLSLSPLPTANHALAYNHNGRMLVAGGADGMIRVFDMSSGEAIMGWPAHNGAVGGVTGVAFTSDETSVISHGADGALVQWSLHQLGSELFSYNTAGLTTPSASLSGLALDGDGAFMVVGTAANAASIFKIDRSSPAQALAGHSAPVTAVDWHPTLNCAITGSADATVRVSKLLTAV